MSKESMQKFLEMLAKNPEMAEKVKGLAQEGPQALIDYARDLGFEINEEDLKELGEKATEAFKKQVKRRTQKLIADLEKDPSYENSSMKNLLQFIKHSEEDDDVKGKLNELSTTDPSAIVDYAKDLGYEFTAKDLDDFGKALLDQEEELSDEELDQVAGGVIDLVSLGIFAAAVAGAGAVVVVGAGVAVVGVAASCLAGLAVAAVLTSVEVISSE